MLCVCVCWGERGGDRGGGEGVVEDATLTSATENDDGG